MSFVADCIHRGSRGAPSEVASSRISPMGDIPPVGDEPVRCGRRRVAVAVAVTAFFYLSLLARTAENGPASRVDQAATAVGERVQPYEEAVAHGWAGFQYGASQVLSWIDTFGHWPLIALTLLWLAGRHQRTYVRAVVALLLSGLAGLVVFAVLQGRSGATAGGAAEAVVHRSQAHGDPLSMAHLQEYMTLPGLHAGWLLLMALAVLAAARGVWIRTAAVVLAVLLDAAVVLTGDHLLLDALLTAGVPLLAWYAAGLADGLRRPSKRAVAPAQAAPIQLRPTAQALWSEPDPVPLRSAS